MILDDGENNGDPRNRQFGFGDGKDADADPLRRGQRPPVPALYVSGARWDLSRHPLDLLARLLMLPVYGAAAATGRARFQLRAAAWLLLVVFLFECAMWFLVLNGLAHPDAARFEGRGSYAAVLGAFVFGSAMLVLEWSIMVSDTQTRGAAHSKWRKRALSRAGLILASAVITCLPVELIGFAPALEAEIFKRNMRETIHASTMQAIQEIEQAKRHLTEVVRSGSQGAAPLPDDTGVEVISLGAEATEIVLRKKYETAAGDVTRADNALAGARQYETNAMNALTATTRAYDTKARTVPPVTTEELNKLGNAKDRAQTNYTYAAGRRQAAEKALASAQTARDTACQSFIVSALARRRAVGGPEPDLRGCTSEASQTASAPQPAGGASYAERISQIHEGYADFVVKVQMLRSRKDYDRIKAGFKRYQFIDSDASTDERLYMIKDMVLARAATLPELHYERQSFRQAKVSSPEIRSIQRVFADVAAAMDAQARAEADRMQPVAVLKTLGLILVALVIPSVALVYKVWSGPELRNYYWPRYQAMRGNPEALEEETALTAVAEEERRRGYVEDLS